ncbi:helix-turn-helix domain-containing protein [Streptomyces acidiscabies]|uniref:helix-turn-helix domain-containing protein n=1 Tax=Streptomyces acidiscabies TaxID=42234 RepID=UPI0009510EF9|nr:helix-turn-helix transcriptional regulator [Streptomyces acidiscabies]
MHGEGRAERDGPGWEVDPEDEWGVAVLICVGRQLKLWREAAGMKVVDFAKAIGYGEDMVYKVESGMRIPRRPYLDKADSVLGAGGRVSAMWDDVEKVKYRKSARSLAEMEMKAVQLLSYGSRHVHGLLQTEEFARALMETGRPLLPDDRLEKEVAGRMARQRIFSRSPAPELSFVIEEMALRRPVGGVRVWRGQLEHILDVGQLRNVEIQVLPTACWNHPGNGGRIQILKFADGSAIGRQEDGDGRPVDDPKSLMILEMSYGAIRGEAHSVKESRVFIEQLLGET